MRRCLDCSKSEFVRREFQKDTTGLESFAGVEQRLDGKAREQRRPWQGVATVFISPERARVLAFDGTGANRTPWVTQRAVGWGTVTLLSVDWHDPTLAEWPGRVALLGQTLASTFGSRSLDGTGS